MLLVEFDIFCRLNLTYTDLFFKILTPLSNVFISQIFCGQNFTYYLMFFLDLNIF